MESHNLDENVTLVEDFFGFFYDKRGLSQKVKRFTWRNLNRIEVTVINFGARIISISFPDRNGIVDDIVLGFDDLPGYIFYSKYYVGATIGRMTNMVRDSTILIGKKQHQIKPNTSEYHQKNGGKIGFDQKIWDSHVEGKKVIMSYISPDGEEGYPGSLMTQITFELSERNEFRIDMEAYSTLPTVVNLSNLMYFNLAGHYAGPDHIYKHILTLNCNCFTKQDEDGFSTGEIQNVVHTINDFQVPKTLGKVIGISAKDGFNQNFCINRGVNQDICFVARVLHPPSGRLLELYSDQYGVQLDTANSFGYGLIETLDDLVSRGSNKSSKSNKSFKTTESIKSGEVKSEMSIDSALELIDNIHDKLKDELKQDQITDYEELRSVIGMLKRSTHIVEFSLGDSTIDLVCDDVEALQKICAVPKYIDYLKLIKETIQETSDDDEHIWLCEVVDQIILYSKNLHTKEQPVKAEPIPDPCPVPPTPPPSVSGFLQPKLKKQKFNVIPSFYKNSERIIGKSRRLYTMHGGIALQTQNYPNCENIENFPNCVLKPGEKYTHTIIYKFWIRSGNPSRWIKRNQHEMSQMKKD